MLLAKGITGNDFMKQLQKVIYAVMTLLKSISDRQHITPTKHTHTHTHNYTRAQLLLEVKWG